MSHICVSDELGQHCFREWVVAKQLPEPRWLIVNWTLMNKLQWNSNENTKIFIHENTLQDVVCEIAAILSRGRWVYCVSSRPISLHVYFDIKGCRLPIIWQNTCARMPPRSIFRAQIYVFLVNPPTGFQNSECVFYHTPSPPPPTSNPNPQPTPHPPPSGYCF